MVGGLNVQRKSWVRVAVAPDVADLHVGTAGGRGGEGEPALLEVFLEANVGVKRAREHRKYLVGIGGDRGHENHVLVVVIGLELFECDIHGDREIKTQTDVVEVLDQLDPRLDDADPEAKREPLVDAVPVPRVPKGVAYGAVDSAVPVPPGTVERRDVVVRLRRALELVGRHVFVLGRGACVFGHRDRRALRWDHDIVGEPAADRGVVDTRSWFAVRLREPERQDGLRIPDVSVPDAELEPRDGGAAVR